LPVERLSHPSDGTSAKLCALSDFEFRVWHQVRLCSNDLGVMLDSAAPLMAENRVLEHKPAAVVRALRRIVELGLLVRFTHQGVGFLCSPLWQDYQRVRYPRASHLPIPTGEAFAACSAKTQELFREVSGKVSEEVQENPKPPARGRARNANAIANAEAVAQGEPEREPEPDLTAARFETFWDAYPRKVAKQDAIKAFHALKPGHELLATMLDALARWKASPGWREPRYIPHPDKWLRGKRWTDEPEAGPKPKTAEPEAPGWHAHCPHSPKCLILTQCAEAWAVEKARLLEDSEVEVPA
jgi:hypothetical protein